MRLNFEEQQTLGLPWPAISEEERLLCKIISSGDQSSNQAKGHQEFFACEFTLH